MKKIGYKNIIVCYNLFLFFNYYKFVQILKHTFN